MRLLRVVGLFVAGMVSGSVALAGADPDLLHEIVAGILAAITSVI